MDEGSDGSLFISDTKLVELAQTGNKEAFADLYDHYHPQLARYIVGLGVSPAESNDLLQEAFLKAWKDLPSLQHTSKFKPWLYRIATNVVHDYWRKPYSAKRDQRLSLESYGENDDPPDSAQRFDERLEEQELVRQALDNVPAKPRQCLILEILGCSREEIAEVAHIHPASVGTYISKARRIFRQAYYCLGSEPPKEETRSTV